MVAFLAKSYLICNGSVSASPESSQPAELSREEPFLADYIYAEVEQGKCTVVEPGPYLTTLSVTASEHSPSEPKRERKQKVSIAGAASELHAVVL